MGGGLLQLVAYGAQDVYITGNPQVTFFKLVYRRHTNFSMETIEQTFNGSADFGKKVTCTLSRNGDLVHKIWLAVTLKRVDVPANCSFRWLNWLGHLMINYVEFEIGGQKIDKQYGEWMHIYSELTVKSGHASGYNSMIGNVPQLTNIVNGGTSSSFTPSMTLYVPLQFYFCRNPGLSVPLVALQYHEVKINVEFRPVSECIFQSGTNSVVPPSMDSAFLLVDYVFLDSDERRRFAQISHEYLITQIQFTGDESATSETQKFKLAFNHPTKEIVWASVKDQHVAEPGANPKGPSSGKQWFNFTTHEDTTYLTGTGIDPAGGFGAPSIALEYALSNLMGSNQSYDLSRFTTAAMNPTKNAKLVLNGHDRFASRDGRWFNLAVPYACHENTPPLGINVYSFALKPEEHQPSGSINLSRIDTCALHMNFEANSLPCKVKIYAVSYNILRIMSGMGGLAYSN